MNCEKKWRKRRHEMMNKDLMMEDLRDVAM
jgi:hypothetical protein